MRLLALGTFTLASLTACAPRSGASGGSCNDSSFELPGDAAPAFTPRDSTVFLEVDVPMSTILSRVEKEAPRQLAAEKGREIGAAGRADFVVHRGAPTLRADGKTLELDVPIRATIDVCKPLGSMCLGYGHCEPAFTARFRSSARLDGFDWPDLRSSIHVEKRCVIAVDVTDPIATIAQRELAHVEKRIEKSLPPLEASLNQAWDRARAPLTLADGSCWSVEPRESFYLPPRVENGRLRLGVGVTGRVDRPSDCARPAPASSAKASAPRLLAAPPASPTVELPFTFESARLAARLGEQLARAPHDDLRIQRVHASPRRDGVLFRLELAGDFCGSIELLADPSFDAARATLGWTNLRFAAAVPEDLRRAVTSIWGSAATLALPELLAQKQAVLVALDERVKSSLTPDVPLRVTRQISSPDRGRAETTSSGVVVALEVSGVFALEVIP